jgi:hypothetical protein
MENNMAKIPREQSIVVRRHANGVSVTTDGYSPSSPCAVFVFNNHKDMVAHILATLDFPDGSHAAAEKAKS